MILTKIKSIKPKNKKMKNNPLTTISIIALAIVVIVLAFNFHAEDSGETISVTGMAEIEVVSNEATIAFGIETIADDSKTAEKLNSEIANKVIAKIKELVGKDSVETVSYNIYENNEWDYKTQTYTNKGFKATHQIKVTTSDLEIIGDVIQLAMNEGATTLNGISFGLSKAKEKELRTQSLENAVDVAYEKAKIISKASNVKLNGVKSVTENNYYYTPYEYSANVRMDDMTGGNALKNADIQPQKLTIRSNVAVSYAIN